MTVFGLAIRNINGVGELSVGNIIRFLFGFVLIDVYVYILYLGFIQSDVFLFVCADRCLSISKYIGKSAFVYIL